MCDLKAAMLCREAITPHLSKIAESYPDHVVVTYLEGDESQRRVRVKICPSRTKAEEFRESLTPEQRQGSLLIELPKDDVVMML